ncbi:hypothetical protein ACFWPV_29710 [Streptomyces uncialis]|uniref:hypothetical protein n=1 Tax=Streptomyces uncialis TaxID=1048205 RepID=UPI00366767C9
MDSSVPVPTPFARTGMRGTPAAKGFTSRGFLLGRGSTRGTRRGALTARQYQLLEKELGGATVETAAEVLRHWLPEVASEPEDEEVFIRLEAERSRL